ncbi:MAG: hypothetical protein JRI23_13490 [Deltaproteobacteria bacterium]|jgi:haloalkane dehalogenase|nr:hypothetical protein [Deltaproteobacteria bacterium]MBW2532741.1 hypothetical protein [Deltaproteobacteria bacterium]
MLENRILLTTPCYPYPTLPANDSLTDATGQRFTHGDHIFSIFSHTHCYANHILAQNISVPSVVLEYPRWQDFTDEVDRGYPIVGISAFPPHLDRVMEMCTYVRQRSPASKILLGSYGGQAFQASYDLEEQQQYVDHVVHGEGVRFLRRLLGDPTDQPIRQALMPKAGGCPPYVSRFPQGSIGFLVSGLGCIGGCDFCSSTALFDRRRIELLSPEQLVHHMVLFHRHFPEVSQVFVIEEDHFRQPKYLAAMREHWLSEPSMVESLDWFAFGSIDHIGRFAKEYGWDAIPETGIGAIFIGVESKFAGDHGYDKRDEADAREVFDRLHSLGVRTIGAWMCGWDFHHHGNMVEDLNYFVALHPTYQQLTRVSPFPGTPLWERLREEGRVTDVPWDDVHFWSGAQKNVHLESHETLNLVEDGYDLMYRTWGPSVLRRLDVQLSGLEYCRRSKLRVMRREKARFHRRQCAMLWTNLYAMDRFAPNGVVRRRVRKIDEKYRRVVGEPTPVMKALARGLEAMATVFKIKEPLDPLNRHPKE